MRSLKFYLIASFLAFVIITMVSCGCKERTSCPLEDHIELIGMYKPGNWWIYETSDGLLSDTIVVVETDTTIEDYCETHYVLRAKLNYFSNNFSSTNSNLTATTIYCNTLFFVINIEMVDRVWFTITDSEAELDFKNSINFRNEEMEEIAFIQAGNSDHTMFYERDLGPTGWINHDTQDTFYLTKYFIQ